MTIKERISALLGRIRNDANKLETTMDVDGVKVDVYGGGNRYVMTNTKGHQVEAKVSFDRKENGEYVDGYIWSADGTYSNVLDVELSQDGVRISKLYQGHVAVEDDETRSEAFAKLLESKKDSKEQVDRLMSVVAKAGVKFHEEKDRPLIAERVVKKEKEAQANADVAVKTAQRKKVLDTFFDR